MYRNERDIGVGEAGASIFSHSPDFCASAGRVKVGERRPLHQLPPLRRRELRDGRGKGERQSLRVGSRERFVRLASRE